MYSMLVANVRLICSIFLPNQFHGWPGAIVHRPQLGRAPVPAPLPVAPVAVSNSRQFLRCGLGKGSCGRNLLHRLDTMALRTGHSFKSPVQ